MKRTAFAPRRRPAWLIAAFLSLAGCAYERWSIQRVAVPEKIRTLERVVVAPFHYPNDWTGLFRDIYARAGLQAPAVRKIEMRPGAFLVRDALTARGYKVLPWPKALEKMKTTDLLSAEGTRAAARMTVRRNSSAQAVLVAAGSRTCPDVEVCAARVEVRLLDLRARETLWESRAAAATARAGGDEMKAAVFEAFAGFPDRSPDSGGGAHHLPAGGEPPP